MYTCTFIYRYKFWIEVIYVNGYLLRFFLFLFLPFSFRMNEWMNLWGEWANVFCSCTCSAIGYSISQSITIYAWCVYLTWLVAMDFLLRKTRTSLLAAQKNAWMKWEDRRYRVKENACVKFTVRHKTNSCMKTLSIRMNEAPVTWGPELK